MNESNETSGMFVNQLGYGEDIIHINYFQKKKTSKAYRRRNG